MKGLRGIFADDITAQSSLDIEQGNEGHAGDAAVLLMLDFAIKRVAKSGAQNADRRGAMTLDFEMDRMAMHEMATDIACLSIYGRRFLINYFAMYGYIGKSKIHGNQGNQRADEEISAGTCVKGASGGGASFGCLLAAASCQ